MLLNAEFEAQSNTETKPKLQDFTKRFPEVAERPQGPSIPRNRELSAWQSGRCLERSRFSNQQRGVHARNPTIPHAQGWRPVAIAVDSKASETYPVPSPLGTPGGEGGRRPDEGAAPGRTVVPTVPEQLGQLFYTSLLLHRPVIPNDSQLRLAKRQAGSAIALLRQGEREKIFSALRVADDPESLTQFVHRCRARGVSTGELWECVQIVERTRPALRGDGRRLEDRVLFGLLLALGEFSLSNIPDDQRDSTMQQLATWYRDDPSSTIHGASGWLLRHWQQTEVARKVDETQLAYSPQREWFTLAIPDGDQTFFQTYVVIPSGEYEIGSPRNEPGRLPTETRRTVRLSRPFALLDREVTRAEFEASAVARINGVDQYSPSPQHPMVAPSWYDSVRYSRWLTAQAGFTEDGQCYADPKSLDSKVFAADPNPILDHPPPEIHSNINASRQATGFTPEEADIQPSPNRPNHATSPRFYTGGN